MVNHLPLLESVFRRVAVLTEPLQVCGCQRKYANSNENGVFGF